MTLPYGPEKTFLEHWKKDVDDIAEWWVESWDALKRYINWGLHFCVGIMGGLLLTVTSPLWLASYLLWFKDKRRRG